MGKSASKLKKRRSQSVSWSFRFPSLSSLHRAKMARVPVSPAQQSSFTDSNRLHLDVQHWLNTLELSQYEQDFSRYSGVEDLLYFSEADIKHLGVKNSAHRARIVSSLLALKIKYENNLKKNKENSLQRHSVALTSRRIINSIEEITPSNNYHQSQSLCDLMEPTGSENATDAVALKKALEWELSLDTRDLCSHAWYHGAIPRARAEEIVQHDGEFLVRDCTSHPGNYVLTCRTKGQPLHFVISKVVIQPDTVYERVQYQFEDDAYDTVPDLITYYVGSGKPISAASGARIQFPRNRMYPLSFYATKYPAPYPPSRLVSPATTPLMQQNPTAFRYTPYSQNSYNYNKQMSSPQRSGPDIRPRLPSKKQRSQSLTPSEAKHRTTQEKCNSADGVIQSPLMTRSAGADSNTNNFSTHSLPRSPCTKMSLPSNSSRSKHIVRVTSDPSLSPCAERRHICSSDENDENVSKSPPPKPSRLPSLLRTDSKDSADVVDGRLSVNSNDIGFPPNDSIQRVASYHASGSDSGNGSGDSAQSSATGDSTEPNHRNSGVIIKNPRFNITNSESSITLKNIDFDYTSAEEEIMKIASPVLELKSKFDLDNFHSLLLPPTENKPLDMTALEGLKVILRESGPRILANHLTRIDLQIIYGDKESPEDSEFISSGVELCSLPHGHQLRLDLIERTVCMRLIVAVSILTCPTDTERAETLNKWIEVAIDTKTALGNLYGFCGVMLGLCTPQVEKLDSTWHMLRQKYTDSAFNFEAKLRPTLKSMNECTNPQAPNTTIPHLLPIILLQERSIKDFTNSSNLDQSSLVTSCLTPWESKSPDLGLSTIFAHIEAARKFNENVPTFRRNAEIILGDINRLDDLTLDAFRTEFHLKFLWGSRGVYHPSIERHEKFERILKALADKYCEVSVGINM